MEVAACNLIDILALVALGIRLFPQDNMSKTTKTLDVISSSRQNDTCTGIQKKKRNQKIQKSCSWNRSCVCLSNCPRPILLEDNQAHLSHFQALRRASERPAFLDFMDLLVKKVLVFSVILKVPCLTSLFCAAHARAIENLKCDACKHHLSVIGVDRAPWLRPAADSRGEQDPIGLRMQCACRVLPNPTPMSQVRQWDVMIGLA